MAILLSQTVGCTGVALQEYAGTDAVNIDINPRHNAHLDDQTGYVFVEEVDGAKAATAKMELLGVHRNHVAVSPGRHVLRLSLYAAKDASYSGKNGQDVTRAGQSITVDCDSRQHYLFTTELEGDTFITSMLWLPGDGSQKEVARWSVRGITIFERS